MSAIPSSSLPNEEPRKSRRTELIVQIDCRGQGAIIVGRSLDISTTGLSMVTPEPLEPGTPVTLRIALPGSPMPVSVQVAGIVAGVQPGASTAILFTNLNAEARAAIAAFVEQEVIRANRS